MELFLGSLEKSDSVLICIEDWIEYISSWLNQKIYSTETFNLTVFKVLFIETCAVDATSPCPLRIQNLLMMEVGGTDDVRFQWCVILAKSVGKDTK